MEYKITIADVCELAHRLTVREYERFGCESSSDEAQRIFNSYYKLIIKSFGI